MAMVQPLLFSSSIHTIFSTASEYRAWILFYALPVLEGILPDVHLQHLALLVTSLHLLLGQNITTQQLTLCEHMLDEFYRNFEVIYGE